MKVDNFISKKKIFEKRSEIEKREKLCEIIGVGGMW